LEVEVVVAGKADLGAARMAGLEDEAAGLPGCGLVELQPVARALMGEEARLGGDREAVDGPRLGVDAEASERPAGPAAEGLPAARAADQRLALGLDIELPAGS